MATAREVTCERYLESKRTQLWKGPGNLSDREERAEAARWFLREMDSFLKFVEGEAARNAARPEHVLASPGRRVRRISWRA